MDTLERDKQIALDYLNGSITSDLALDYRLSIARIFQILREQGATGKDSPERAKLIPEGPKYFSPIHIKLGHRLFTYRAHTLFQERSSAAVDLGWSVKKLALVEKGETQLTLTEMIQVAQYMQVSLSSLMKDLEHTGPIVSPLEGTEESPSPEDYLSTSSGPQAIQS
jgi:hypothetical protein